MALGIRSLIGHASLRPVETFQCSTPKRNYRRQPKSCFGENQLLLGSISFSLLTTGHPMELNDQTVRASRLVSQTFTLPMVSSPSFGSLATALCRAIHTRFRYASGGKPLRRGRCKNSLAHSSIGTPSPHQGGAPTPCKRMVSGLFHRPLRATFHLSLTVLVHYRSFSVFSLTG